jgi:galactoside O-acetyltransferase
MGMFYRIKKLLFVDLRILKFKILSTCDNVCGKPVLYHPLLFAGYGKISIGENMQNGVISSQHYYTHYNLFEARTPESEIVIGKNVAISNNVSIIALKKISVGDNVIIGHSCSIIDADGHKKDPQQRNSSEINANPVIIKNNVLLYANVTVTKGVTIGENSIIGTGSIVTKDIPANVVAAGNPCLVIHNL